MVNGLLAQKNSWHLFQSNAANKNIQFTISSSVVGPNYPKPPNDPSTGQPFTAYLATNLATDKNGSLLFYVICTRTHSFVFDRSNKLLDYWIGGSKEIAIIPMDNGVRYQIICGGSIHEFHLGRNEIYETARGSGVGKVLLVAGPHNNYSDMVVAARINYQTEACISGFFCYSIDANTNGESDRKIIFTKYTKSKYDYSITPAYSNITYNITSQTQGFNWYVSEIDLSADGTKLAIADNQKILIFSVNPTTGELTSGISSYSFNYNTGSLDYRVGGLEFTPDNNLVYSVFDPGTNSTTNDGVYHWNLSSGNVTTFTAASDLARSAIEYTKNGKMVVAKSNGLYQLDLGTYTASSLITTFSPAKNIDLYAYYFGSPASYYGIYNLPDQIDGQIQENIDLTETVFTYNFGTSGSGNFNWTNASHGFTNKGNGRVFVINKINLTSISSAVILDGMTIDFYDDAELNVYPGASLTLKGTILKGADCGLMWKGISLLKGTGRLKSASNAVYLKKNSGGSNSRILDAYVGIKSIWNFSRIEITEESHLSRNEMHLSIANNSLSRIKITESYFSGHLFLRDLEFGNANGYNDNKKRTTIGIELINANVKLGDATLSNNVFEGGQYAIYAVGSILQLDKAEVKATKQYGLFYTANKSVGKIVSVKNCNFHDLYRGIKVTMGAAETRIQKNTFTNTGGYGIEYTSNPGGKLWIGDETVATLGNTFNNCNWAAISCWDNNKYNAPTQQNPNPVNSDLIIANNTIDNHIYATGIGMGEPVNVDRNFGLLKINKNNMGLNQPIGQGIVLNQIKGANKDLAGFNKTNHKYNPENIISDNKIVYTNVLNSNYCGIHALNSNSLNYLVNEVSDDFSSYSVNGKAIRISDGNNSLVYKNILKGSTGLEVSGNSLFSNYNCNTFNNCATGIMLYLNVLRNSYVSCSIITPSDERRIHGNPFSNSTSGPIVNYGRPNTFNNNIPTGSDIFCFSSAAPNILTYRNRWDFINGIVPSIASNLSTVTVPPCGFNNRLVHSDSRTNPCVGDLVQGTDSLESDIEYSDITDPVLNWRLRHSTMADSFYGIYNQSVNNANLLKIIQTEALIDSRDYVASLNSLNSFIPLSKFDSSFKTVNTIWVQNRLILDSIHSGVNLTQIDSIFIDSQFYCVDTVGYDTAWNYKLETNLSDSLVLILEDIAELNSITENPISSTARAILLHAKQLQFLDSTFKPQPNLTGNVDSNCSNFSGQAVRLFYSSGIYTGKQTLTNSAGKFLFQAVDLESLDEGKKFFVKVIFVDSSELVSDSMHLADLVQNSPYVFECTNSQPSIVQNVNLITNNSISVFPNPSNGSVTVIGLLDNDVIEISDLSGRRIISINSNKNSTVLIDKINPGIYFLSVFNNRQKSYETKIIVY